MAELSIQQMKAAGLVGLSLVESVTVKAPPERREEVSDELINDLWVKWWRGIPGQARRRGAAPTITDTNALQILGVVTKVWGRRLALLLAERG